MNKKIVLNEELLAECNHIIDTLCNDYGIEKKHLLSTSRDGNIPKLRQMAIYLIDHKFGNKVSYQQIGSIFNRDHSTVTYSVRAVASLKETSGNYQEEIERYFKLFNILEKKVSQRFNDYFENKIVEYIAKFSKQHVTKTDSHEALAKHFVRVNKF